MAEHKEVVVERLYLREPNTDKLRKNAAARLRHLLANGWRETARIQKVDYLAVHFERTGHPRLKDRLPKAAPVVQGRFDRRPRQDGRGGPRGGRGGGRFGGGNRGPRVGGAPAAQPPTPAAAPAQPAAPTTPTSK